MVTYTLKRLKIYPLGPEFYYGQDTHVRTDGRTIGNPRFRTSS